MKIIHILVGKADPNTMNGVNKVVHSLATIQTEKGLDVEVWGITSNPSIIRHKHVYKLSLFRRDKTKFRLADELKSSIDKILPDVRVHLHSVFLPEFHLIGRRLKRKGVSWVLTPHGGYESAGWRKNRLTKEAFSYLFERPVVEGASAVHAIGETELASIRNRFKAKKVVLIPNGLVLTDAPSETDGQLIFGFCGRLSTEHKGLDLLVDGMARYRFSGGKGLLWLVGDGSGRSEIENKVRSLGADNHVKFLGAMFGDEKLRALSKMAVFLHTSRWDVLPTAVLEAAGLSKPLLVSKATNFGPYVDQWKCGIVLDENTPEHIAEGMTFFENAHADGGLSEMGRNSRNMAKSEFQWSTIVDAMIEKVYR